MDYFEKLEVLRQVYNLPKNLPTGIFETKIAIKPLTFENANWGCRPTEFAPTLHNFLGNLNKRS